MKVYFAGVNQHHFCETFRGRYVIESFADVRPMMDRYRPTFAGVVLDSGAFTEMTTDKPIDIEAFADFAIEHGAAYDWIASLDAIKGGPDANLANWALLKQRGLSVVPTFHQGEPVELLLHYCANSERVGLGFQRPIRGAREWLRWCFEQIPGATKVHGWAMTSYTDFPFESVDSTTWLYELKALLGVAGQGADVLRCLTHSELIDLVVKKYEREPLRRKWDGSRSADIQASLLHCSAAPRKDEVATS